MTLYQIAAYGAVAGIFFSILMIKTGRNPASLILASVVALAFMGMVLLAADCAFKSTCAFGPQYMQAFLVPVITVLAFFTLVALPSTAGFLFGLLMAWAAGPIIRRLK